VGTGPEEDEIGQAQEEHRNAERQCGGRDSGDMPGCGPRAVGATAVGLPGRDDDEHGGQCEGVDAACTLTIAGREQPFRCTRPE